MSEDAAAPPASGGIPLANLDPDLNQDGKVDEWEAEIYRRIQEADTDKTGILSKQNLFDLIRAMTNEVTEAKKGGIPIVTLNPDTDGDGKIEKWEADVFARIQAADADKSGTISVQELFGVIKGAAESDRQKKLFQKLFIAAVFVIIGLLAGMLAMGVVAGEAVKESHVKGLSTAEGSRRRLESHRKLSHNEPFDFGSGSYMTYDSDGAPYPTGPPRPFDDFEGEDDMPPASVMTDTGGDTAVQTAPVESVTNLFDIPLVYEQYGEEAMNNLDKLSFFVEMPSGMRMRRRATAKGDKARNLQAKGDKGPGDGKGPGDKGPGGPGDKGPGDKGDGKPPGPSYAFKTVRMASWWVEFPPSWYYGGYSYGSYGDSYGYGSYEYDEDGNWVPPDISVNFETVGGDILELRPFGGEDNMGSGQLYTIDGDSFKVVAEMPGPVKRRLQERQDALAKTKHPYRKVTFFPVAAKSSHHVQKSHNNRRKLSPFGGALLTSGSFTMMASAGY
jgi:Ca2+-binding EF-hand superfamily protein